jgi:hypothetical protein
VQSLRKGYKKVLESAVRACFWDRPITRLPLQHIPDHHTDSFIAHLQTSYDDPTTWLANYPLNSTPIIPLSFICAFRHRQPPQNQSVDRASQAKRSNPRTTL